MILMLNEKKNRVINLGCRLNFYESEIISSIISDTKHKNKIVVNTCAVTNQAVQKSLYEIRKVAKNFPNSEIVVTGCASEVDKKLFENLKNVSMIVENKFKTIPQSYDEKKLDFKKFKFPNFLSSKSSRTRATIQIQQGCDHRCTFCIIPYGRGEALSLPVGEVSRRIEEVLSKGYKEIIFTGVDLTSYGNDLPGKPTLGNLIRRLIKLHPSIERLRLSSIDPAEVDGELMDLLKFEPRLMPHIHLSVQSGDDLILKRMKRRHLRSDVIKLCEELKSKRPNITFGADFIIGFPTEKEENFKNTLDLITQCKFSNVHLFPFSPKKGTPAERMPQVDIKKIKNRMTVARSHAVEVQKKLMQSSIGQKVNILFESMLQSYTDNFFKVELNSRNTSKNFPGSILKVKLNSLRNGKFLAENI
jgi:threonylcarbamoyladenosine tRNA methylthiotransferase MtaB